MSTLDETARFVVQFRAFLPVARQQASEAGACGVRLLVGAPVYAAAFSITFLDMQVLKTADRLLRLTERLIPELQKEPA